MEDRSFIVLHRRFLSWEWHTDPVMVSLFIHLLCMANYIPNKKYRGRRQKVGEVVTSVDALAKQTGLCEKTVRVKLGLLKKTGEIKTKTSNKGTIIQVAKFADYQYSYKGCSVSNTEQSTEQNTEQRTEQAQKTSKKTPKTTQNASVVTGTGSTGCEVGAVINTEPSTEPDTEQKKDENCDNNNINNIIEDNNILSKKSKEKKVAEIDLSDSEAVFDAFRKAYKGTKRGLKTELDNFKKKNANWRELVLLLMPALEKEIAWREQAKLKGQFVPEWAHLQTWLNQRRWETEFEVFGSTTGTPAGGAYQQPAAPVQPTSQTADYDEGFSFEVK